MEPQLESEPSAPRVYAQLAPPQIFAPINQVVPNGLEQVPENRVVYFHPQQQFVPMSEFQNLVSRTNCLYGENVGLRKKFEKAEHDLQSCIEYVHGQHVQMEGMRKDMEETKTCYKNSLEGMRLKCQDDVERLARRMMEQDDLLNSKTGRIENLEKELEELKKQLEKEKGSVKELEGIMATQQVSVERAVLEKVRKK